MSIKKTDWLIFELGDNEAWAFPRVQLARVSADDPEPECWHYQTENGTIKLKFPIQEMEVRSLHPRELLAAVLAGKIKHLARGPDLKVPEGCIGKLYEQTPSEHYELAPDVVRTGEIRPCEK